MLPEDRSILGDTSARSQAVIEAGEKTGTESPPDAQASLQPSTDSAAVARGSSSHLTPAADAPEPSPTRKRDWL